MTQTDYLALLDTLLLAAELEDAKAAEGREAMAQWARAAVPRWAALSRRATEAEAAQPAETLAWYIAWRHAQHRSGRWRLPVATLPVVAEQLVLS